MNKTVVIHNMCYTEKLGLITKLESPNTGVDPEAAEEFLKLKKTDDDSVYGSMNTNSIDDGWVSHNAYHFHLK